MIKDEAKAVEAVRAALAAAGYSVRISDNQVDVTERGTYRGKVVVGRYLNFTRLCPAKVQRLANAAAEGC